MSVGWKKKPPAQAASYCLIRPLKSHHREVVAVGPGKAGDDGKVRAPDVKKGDKVLFGQYGGSTVKIDGEELLILQETEIFGVLEG